MPHAWILDVLADLKTYAEGNALPATAKAADDTLKVAQKELAGLDRGGNGQSPG